MPKKKSHITFKDQFCGCGGSSQAVRRLSEKNNSGLQVEWALNHWPLAIRTHNTNFQNTKHDCANISSTNPRRYSSTDFLITSPECTEQTKANGRAKPKKQMDMFATKPEDPAMEKSRATMWDVPRFAEYHRYNYIIVENVWEAQKWINFENWLRVMHTLGYNHKIVHFNSMFAFPTPQSRDRIYIHFWKKGNPAPNLEYTPLANCPKCGKEVNAVQSWKKKDVRRGVYGKRGQYLYCCPHDGSVVYPYYYAALNAIDWDDIGTKIGDRKKPLAPNTLKRIKIGKKKLEGHPFFIQAEHSQNFQNIRSILDVFPTQATRQTLGFVFPCIIENKGTSFGRSSTLPIGTLTTHSYHGILIPDNFNSFISYYYGGSNVSSHVFDPVNTFTTVQGSALIRPASQDINEWHYRMIKPNEGKRIMNFDDDYVIHGNSKEQFIQLGNAVTPAAMEWQIERAIQTLN